MPDAAETLRAALDARLAARDRAGAVTTALDAVHDGSIGIADLYTGVLGPLLVDTGSAWQQGAEQVWEEHFASATVRTIVEALYPDVLRARDEVACDGERVLLACPSGEQHDLGLRMVADRFALCGWEVDYLGADTPTDEIVDAAQTLDAHVVVLSASTHFNRVLLRDVVDELQRRLPGVMVFVGSLIQSLQANLVDQTIGNGPQITMQAFKNGDPVVYSQQMRSLLAKDPRVKTGAVAAVRVISALWTNGTDSAPLNCIGSSIEGINGIYKLDKLPKDRFLGTETLGLRDILLGKDFCDKYGIRVGDSVNLIFQGNNTATFKVQGIYDLGSAAFNERNAFVNENVPRSLLGWNSTEYTAIYVQVTKPFTAGVTALQWRTQLNQLGLLDTPSAGTITYRGTDVSKLSKTKRAKLRNDLIGFVFQFHYLLPEFSVIDNVLMPSAIAGPVDDELRKRAVANLTALCLEGLADKNANDLSGGQKQRVAIARALMNQPALILADEPTGNLDTVNTEQVYDLLRAINEERGTAFLIVTHDRQVAQRADRILEISDGILVQDARNQYLQR